MCINSMFLYLFLSPFLPNLCSPTPIQPTLTDGAKTNSAFSKYLRKKKGEAFNEIICVEKYRGCRFYYFSLLFFFFSCEKLLE